MQRFDAPLRELAGRADAETDRQKLHAEVYALRRRISLANPLIDFDRVLFCRTNAVGGHVCDQFFGFHATPGGLYVADGVFGANPSVRDLLADAAVENGRLKGQKLRGGVNTPALSFDAKTVYFAHCETAQASRSRAPGWSQETCYHLFSIDIDGTALRQLTDGPWNDFDPCPLPNGRIAFISERRGGYGRCHGRPVPTYTLHRMAADGSRIECLSWHETNEWNPSLTHDGMIVYTRWDYFDRSACIAHHPWITSPDGRDARAIHGNYPQLRNARPDAELDVRAIPGSSRFIAVAAGHHGGRGGLVIFDPRVKDDGAMSQVKRINPDVPFPEIETNAKRGGAALESPWPLSEDYYLCGLGSGLGLADAFGHQDPIHLGHGPKIYRPIPVKPRPVPPIVPAPPPAPASGPVTGPADRGEAVVCLANVYNSRYPRPVRPPRQVPETDRKPRPQGPDQPRRPAAHLAVARAELHRRGDLRPAEERTARDDRLADARVTGPNRTG